MGLARAILTTEYPIAENRMLHVRFSAYLQDVKLTLLEALDLMRPVHFAIFCSDGFM